MKKLLLLLALAFSIQGYSQTMMVVDSIKVLPQNPTANDSVYLHIYWHCSYGCGLQMPMNVTGVGNNHNVSACYLVGLIAVLTSGDDSVFLFQGPAGMHNVMWQVVQNGTPSTSCDFTHAGGQTQINVLPTGIEEHADQSTFQWNPGLEEFSITSTGLFSVYSTTGQCVYEANVIAGQRVIIRAYAGQMYCATLRQDNGAVNTLKFVIE